MSYDPKQLEEAIQSGKLLPLELPPKKKHKKRSNNPRHNAQRKDGIIRCLYCLRVDSKERRKPQDNKTQKPSSD